MVARFEIYLLNLDATVGREAKNTRPCVVVSPDELNRSERGMTDHSARGRATSRLSERLGWMCPTPYQSSASTTSPSYRSYP